MEKELLKGNIAIARAALNCGCKCYFGYPITPQTEIGEYLSLEMQRLGLGYVCAESEIGAINMALGAASTGTKSLVSSSSCAVALMQETLSYACSDELPVVLVNVMRAGPGQGYIYPSQGDYNQAVTGGGNGDYKTIVLAPSTVQECVDFTYRAFYLAFYYKTPVIVLADGLLGQMAEPCEISKNPYAEPDTSNWRLDGKKNRASRKIHSLEPDQNKLNRHIFGLKQKFDYIEQNEVEYEEYLTQDANVIITAFGSMARCCKDIVNFYRQKGVKIGLFRPKTLYPFPYKRLRELSYQTSDIIDIEMNLGQMLKDVSLAVMTNSKVSFVGKPVGSWLTSEEIIAMTNKILDIKEESASEVQNANI